MTFPDLFASTDTEQKLQEEENELDTLVFSLPSSAAVPKPTQTSKSSFPKRTLAMRRHSSSHSSMSNITALSTKAKVHDFHSLKTTAKFESNQSSLKSYSTNSANLLTTSTTTTVIDKEQFEFISNKLIAGRRESLTIPAHRIPEQSASDFGKLTLVLDVDETLIHSRINPQATQNDYRQFENRKLNPNVCDEFLLTLTDGDKVSVNKRPFLDEFLNFCKNRFEIVAFTAGLKQYAEPLLDSLDPRKEIFKHRLYRDSCLFISGYYLKDLQLLNRNLKRTVLVDNNPVCFLPQLSNGIPIANFYDDPNDQALKSLMNYLAIIEKLTDVRPKLKENFGLEKMLKQKRNEVLGDTDKQKDKSKNLNETK